MSPTKAAAPEGRSIATQPARDGGSTKLAATVADRIIRDIAELGWPEGKVLGSESDLLEHYGISRAVFREAVRIVELRHIARMRRGPGGGLVVMIPSVEAVVDAVSIYLSYVKADVDEVFEARLALESVAAELAPDRLRERDIEAVRDLVRREQAHEVEDYREFHGLIASLTGNAALEFFIDLLNRSTFLFVTPRSRVSSKVVDDSVHAHTAIAGAVLKGNGGLARSRMRKHLRAEAAFLRRRRRGPAQQTALPLIGRTAKLPEVTARRIFEAVIEGGWHVGSLLGSEAELIERYEVSRAVLREAVRLLEHHGIAYMRRGPGGGLFVSQPGIHATTEAIALHVERNGITPAEMFEVRVAVEMAVLERVMQHLDDHAIGVLEAALATERAASRSEFVTVGHDLHAVLADLSGNRVLQLLTQVLLLLHRRRGATPVGATDPFPTGDVIKVHTGIVEAMLDRDVELARYRARRHLEALQHWVR